MKIAERIERLGTETAFAVSAEADAFAAEGNKVYPFYLGDMNILTPTIVTGAMRKKGLADDDEFRRTVLHETRVSFCTRLHFGRFLSGINVQEIREGLERFKTYIES